MTLCRRPFFSHNLILRVTGKIRTECGSIEKRLNPKSTKKVFVLLKPHWHREFVTEFSDFLGRLLLAGTLRHLYPNSLAFRQYGNLRVAVSPQVLQFGTAPHNFTLSTRYRCREGHGQHLDKVPPSDN